MKKSRILFLILSFVFSLNLLFAASDALKKGRVLERQSKYEQALEVYKKAIKQNPTEALYIEAAALLGKMQKYENAGKVLELGLKDFPDSKSLKNLLALIMVRTNQNQKAIKLLKEVLEADSDNGFAKKWLAKIEPTDESSPDTTQQEAHQSVDQSLDSSTPSSSPDGVYRASNELPLQEQKELAKKLYQQMMGLEKWELDYFKDLHKEVIEKCPETTQAEESCWRLSNLYLLGEDPPNYQAVINVLEHLLKQYPDTPLFPDAKNRLLISYQKTNQTEKVVELYQELFTLDPDPIDDKVFMVRALEFADALRSTGREVDAQAWYMKIIEKDDGKGSLEARVARQRLEGEN
ncbi:MAG: tetratricopeptide repeat protein [Candidatus Rifleibacteriota bacterium]